MKNERALQIVKTLEEHQALGGFSVEEIAEELGEFPSDVEQEFKRLQKAGAIKCYMYQGKLYAVFQQGLDLEKLKDEDNVKPDVMYR